MKRRKGNALFSGRKKLCKKDFTGDANWVGDASCFRQLSVWAGCKERFKIRLETISARI